MFNILVVEDDKKIREQLCVLLRSNGYNDFYTLDFNNISHYIECNNINLVLLDINLEGSDGFKICESIRKSSDVPIIFVTSRDSDIDELMSITIGGDDFIKKPYNTSVLLARINSILKRVYKKSPAENFEHNGVSIDFSVSKVSYMNSSEELTKNEMKILAFLIKNKGKIISRVEIMEHLWDNSMFINDNTLTVNINRIRTKLDSIGAIEFIKTKRGQGYII